MQDHACSCRFQNHKKTTVYNYIQQIKRTMYYLDLLKLVICSLNYDGLFPSNICIRLQVCISKKTKTKDK